MLQPNRECARMCSCLPVPLQPLVVKPVEEVRLRAHRPDVGMDAQELQQGARPSLLHPDYDRLRKLLGAEGVGHGHAAALRALRGAVRQLPRRVAQLCARGGCVQEQTRRWSQVVQNAATIVHVVIVQRLLAENSSRSGIAQSAEAVEEVGEDQEHGKEHRHFGEHLAKVEPDSASATSHELISCAT